MKWLSGLDVNAVFAAILAVIAYVHNHRFRVQVATDTVKPPTGPGVATVALVLACIACAMLPLACGATPKEQQTYAGAATVCTAATLANLTAKLGDVETQHSTATDVVFAVDLALEEILCIRATVKVATAMQGSGG